MYFYQNCFCFIIFKIITDDNLILSDKILRKPVKYTFMLFLSYQKKRLFFYRKPLKLIKVYFIKIRKNKKT